MVFGFIPHSLDLSGIYPWGANDQDVGRKEV